MSEDYKARARKRAQERQQSSWFKLKEGDNTFRILPTPESKASQGIWQEYAVHREVGVKKVTVRCGKTVPEREGSCWLCDSKIPTLRKAGREARADALAPSDVFVVQVAKVDEEGKMYGPYIFTPAAGVANQLLTSVIGSRKRDYHDSKKGYNLTLNRTGTSRNDTRYGMIEPDDSPSKVPSTIIDVLKPFSELREIPKYSEAKQKAAYAGQEVVEDDDEDETEEETPKSKKSKKTDEDEAPKKGKSKGKSEEDEDEEDAEPDDEAEDGEDPDTKTASDEDEDDSDSDDEEEDDKDDAEEEDEEEEKPTPKKGKGKVAAKKSKADDEDEDEPAIDDDEEAEDSDDDEKDEAPPKKASGKKSKKDEEEDELDDLDDLDEAEESDDDDPPPPKKTRAKTYEPAPKKGRAKK